ncbi:MAG: isoprenylcysteine carboxylmethyltransferase family protein [Pseudohongiellaceae bacterium]
MSLELKVPPLVVGALVAGVMGLVDYLLPAARLVLPGTTVVAGLLAVVGLGVAIAGVLNFRRARTSVNPMRPEEATAVVDTGIYRISRNPMYLGFLLVLLGFACWLANVAALCVLPLFVVYMNRFQIGPEERLLREKFGAAYTRYQSRVRRWL